MQSLTEQWQAGQFNKEDPAVTHAANIEAVSKIKLLNELIDIDAETLNEEEKGDREQLGVAPSGPRRPGKSD